MRRYLLWIVGGIMLVVLVIVLAVTCEWTEPEVPGPPMYEETTSVAPLPIEEPEETTEETLPDSGGPR